LKKKLGKQFLKKKFILVSLMMLLLFLTKFYDMNNRSKVTAKENSLPTETIQKNSIEEDLNVTQWADYDTYYGKPNAVQIHNDLIYVADVCGDIQILSLNNNQFELVGYYKNELFDSEEKRLAGISSALCISENHLFLSIDEYGIVILNITKPEEPSFLEYHENILADEIYVSGDRLYTLKTNLFHNTTFSIYNISSLGFPFQINNITYDDTFSRMEIQNNIAFIKTYKKISILNITNPYSLTEISHINNSIYGFSVFKHYLIITNYLSNFTIYNLTNIHNPQMIVKLPFAFSEKVYDIHISNNKSYVISRNKIYLFDIINISDPEYIGYIEQNHGEPLLYNGRMILTSVYNLSQITSEVILSYDSYKGLTTYNVTKPTAPTIYATRSYSKARHLAVNQNYIILGFRNKLEILSNTDPANPELICSYDLPVIYIGNLLLDEDILYISASNSIVIYDMQTPENLVHCSTYILPSGYDIEIALDEKRSVLYVSNGILTIIDVKDKFNPVLIATKSFDERSDEIFYKNDVLFISTSGGDWQMGSLIIYDAKDPQSLVSIGGAGVIDGVGAIFADNKYFYYSYVSMGWMKGLTIRDYSNTSSMLTVYTNTSIPYFIEIKAKYNMLYLIPLSYDVEDNMLIILNITDMSNVREVSRYYGRTAASAISKIVIHDQYIYITEGYEGLSILKFNEYQEEPDIEPTTTNVSLKLMTIIPIATISAIVFTKIRSKKKK